MSDWTSAPYWVKLVRNGDNLTGYESSDGSNWDVPFGPVTCSMGTQVYIGLAATAHNRGVLNCAVFDNIQVNSAGRPRIAAVLAGHTLSFSLPTDPGHSYVLEYKSSLTDATWTPLQILPGNGGPVSFHDDTSLNPVRIYRIRVQ